MFPVLKRNLCGGYFLSLIVAEKVSFEFDERAVMRGSCDRIRQITTILMENVAGIIIHMHCNKNFQVYWKTMSRRRYNCLLMKTYFELFLCLWCIFYDETVVTEGEGPASRLLNVARYSSGDKSIT